MTGQHPGGPENEVVISNSVNPQNNRRRVHANLVIYNYSYVLVVACGYHLPVAVKVYWFYKCCYRLTYEHIECPATVHPIRWRCAGITAHHELEVDIVICSYANLYRIARYKRYHEVYCIGKWGGNIVIATKPAQRIPYSNMNYSPATPDTSEIVVKDCYKINEWREDSLTRRWIVICYMRRNEVNHEPACVRKYYGTLCRVNHNCNRITMRPCGSRRLNHYGVRENPVDRVANVVRPLQGSDSPRISKHTIYINLNYNAGSIRISIPRPRNWNQRPPHSLSLVGCYYFTRRRADIYEPIAVARCNVKNPATIEFVGTARAILAEVQNPVNPMNTCLYGIIVVECVRGKSRVPHSIHKIRGREIVNRPCYVCSDVSTAKRVPYTFGLNMIKPHSSAIIFQRRPKNLKQIVNRIPR